VILPLEGLRAIDLPRALSGPFCSIMLADLGVLHRVTLLAQMDTFGWCGCYRASPLLGEHPREVLIEYRIASGRVDALAAAGVVQQHP
jgi:crotonobetainyl-CoA:carnitine CoA-transferase CaiB-like acyl-CoA transferase